MVLPSSIMVLTSELLAGLGVLLRGVTGLGWELTARSRPLSCVLSPCLVCP